MSEPTLLVADDHPLFRAAVLHVLRERLPQYRTLEAASAATLGQALQEHPEVELVLLDLSMPGTRGFSALLHVRGEYPELPVVIISSNDHPRVIRRAQQFGAAGFIPKSAPADAMGDAIRAVLDGGSWFPPMAAERSEADAELATVLSDELGAIRNMRQPDYEALTELWAATHDARGYCVLGDPAVRLHLTPAVPQNKEISCAS